MEQKEGFCTMCSVQVPSAFSDYDGGYENEDNKNSNKFKKFINSCNIPVMLILGIVIYLIFFYKK